MNRQSGRSRLAASLGQQGTQITQRPCKHKATLLGALEEVRLAVGPGEGGVQVGGQPVPVPRYAARVPVRDGLVRQPPILHAVKIQTRVLECAKIPFR